jgi:hypothetical protein
MGILSVFLLFGILLSLLILVMKGGDNKMKQKKFICGILLTRHAIDRVKTRNICLDIIKDVLEFGRCKHARGAIIYVIGKREVKAYKDVKDLSRCEGIHVVCSSKDNIVITVYRNKKSFRSLCAE